MATIPGVDIYHDDDVQLHDLQGAGMQFCIVKATEGLAYVDPTFAQRWGALGDPSTGLTMLRGAYHFFTADDTAAQAAHFLATVPWRSGDLRLSLDVETEFDGVADAAMVAAEAIKTATGYYPFLYCNHDFWVRLLNGSAVGNACHLWLARYGVNDPGVTCSLWQYTDTGDLTDVNGTLDLDVYYGSVTDMQNQDCLA